MKCEKVVFPGRKWENNKTSIVSVALLVTKGISRIAIKRIIEMIPKGISKIMMEEISEC